MTAAVTNRLETLIIRPRQCQRMLESSSFKKGDVSKLTKLEIPSLLLRCFSTEVENIATTKKEEIVEKFNAVSQKNPYLLSDGGVSTKK